jgi:hypothetical protein
LFRFVDPRLASFVSDQGRLCILPLCSETDH